MHRPPPSAILTARCHDTPRPRSRIRCHPDLLGRWGDRARGVGDDAAILDVPPGEQLVVSTDSSIEDRHFRRAWLSPREIGYRATAAALSDLAAMGARPLGVIVAIAVPTDWRDSIGDLADGIGEAASLNHAPTSAAI